MIETKDITRPPAEWSKALAAIGTATVSSTLSLMGVRDVFMQGPVAWTNGRAIAGPALTLQFMPKREDVMAGIAVNVPEEQLEKATALWAVFETIEPGDVLAVQAFGDLNTGCMGEMLVTYFKGRGGAGIRPVCHQVIQRKEHRVLAFKHP